MRNFCISKLGLSIASLLLFSAGALAVEHEDRLQRVVEEVVRPVMEENGIPGMTVAVTIKGQRQFFNYGVASKESGKKVTEDTLFEIGSISKTFTAVLASYAEETGALSLSDNASKYWPALAGSSLDTISLLDLGTYTAGGLPLQVPDDVTQDKLIAYYKNWRPEYAPGTHRRYSNPSIGLFGHLAARSMGEPFDALMEEKLFPALGLNNTYITVPKNRMGDYAYGYSKDGKPIRVNPGIWDAEAYGVKTSAADLIRFVEQNMNGSGLDETLQRAIHRTQTGYYKVADMVQGLGWEIYAFPTELDRLLNGNSPEVMYKANKVERVVPPMRPREDVLINKTGSTNGFGAYAVFVPAEDIGVVILANKNYPIPERVTAAYRILTAIGGSGAP